MQQRGVVEAESEGQWVRLSAEDVLAVAINSVVGVEEQVQIPEGGVGSGRGCKEHLHEQV